MARYIDADALLERMRLTYCKDCNNYNEIMCRSCLMDDALTTLEDCPTADVAPRAEVAKLQSEVTTLLNDFAGVTLKYEKAKAEVARTFRKRMNEKMGKHTHLLGKEYVQRIMREVEKELIGEEDA